MILNKSFFYTIILIIITHLACLSVTVLLAYITRNSIQAGCAGRQTFSCSNVIFLFSCVCVCVSIYEIFFPSIFFISVYFVLFLLTSFCFRWFCFVFVDFVLNLAANRSSKWSLFFFADHRSMVRKK
jgi:hypothetical protein